MINEIITNPNGSVQLLNWVPIVAEDYGSEGVKPQSFRDCPLGPKSEEESSCVSGSGSSACVYFLGHVSDRVVRCGNTGSE